MIVQDRECVMVEVSQFQVAQTTGTKYKGHCTYIHRYLWKFMLNI